MDLKDKKIIIFDGVCNFCNWAVNFVIRHDQKKIFHFTASQSPAGSQLLRKLGVESLKDKSILLVQGDSFLIKSAAVLEIFKHLQGPWKYVSYLKIFPKFILDWKYSFFSNIRYTIFGKRDSCMIPSDEDKERFIE